VFALHLYAPQDAGFEEITVRETSVFQHFYLQISSYISDANLEGYAAVSYDEGYILISFADNFLFERSFDAVSSRLNARELEILNFMGRAIKSIEDEAAAICVIGHAEPWDSYFGSDRVLSAERANAVLMHLEDNIGIDSEKLVLLAFGNSFPAMDRPNRVEILIRTDNTGPLYPLK
jgi:flagellar motor protein MotB